MGVKFGTEEGTFGPLLSAKFHPHRCNVSPLRGEKPQNRPLSKLNTGRFALRAMLPVIRQVHRRAARFVKRNYYISTTSVSSLISQLGWQTLSDRRRNSRSYLNLNLNLMRQWIQVIQLSDVTRTVSPGISPGAAAPKQSSE